MAAGHLVHPKDQLSREDIAQPFGAAQNDAAVLIAITIVAMYTIEVRHPPFRPTAGYLVWRLSIKWRVAVDRTLAPLGLTHAQYVFLASLFGLLSDEVKPSQRELADHTGLEPLYVSKLARTLETDGLIERVRDPHDTRTLRLSLTDQGRNAVAPAIATVQTLLQELTAPLGGPDAAATQTLMRDLATLLDTPLRPELSERTLNDAGIIRT